MLYDSIVIGAGPAGLTAALYLARYKRSVLVLHDNNSRALRIPKTHNAPGFPEGITGPDLIERMTKHACEFGADIEEAFIVDVKSNRDGFSLAADDGRSYVARTVLLASGIFLNEVDLPREVHEQAIHDDVLRYCPVCDGYEHSDKKIGVIGCDSDGAAEALFLRQFSSNITLMPLEHPELSDEQKAELSAAGIEVVLGKLKRLDPQSDHMNVILEGTDPIDFDVVYPALGCRPRNELALNLGIESGKDGCLSNELIEGSKVPGFFAAGDVLEGLDQISVAMGHGAQAATNVHNWLREQDDHILNS